MPFFFTIFFSARGLVPPPQMLLTVKGIMQQFESIHHEASKTSSSLDPFKLFHNFLNDVLRLLYICVILEVHLRVYFQSLDILNSTV